MPVQYRGESRPLPGYDYETGIYETGIYETGIYETGIYEAEYSSAPAPIDPGRLHLPVAVQPTAPIAAPPRMIRAGRLLFEQPNWVSDPDAEDVNRNTAAIEAMVTDGYRSVGIETTEAERLAAAQVAGGAVGAIGGAAAVGVPAAVTGGLIGAAIGGHLGMGAGSVLVPGIGSVPGGVAGTAAGAGLGAAVAGVPAAVVGAVGGGALGVAAGTVYGAGADASPIDIEVPDVDQESITEQVEATLTGWQAEPATAPVADAVTQFVTADAPALDAQARAVVAAQPGGEQVLEQADNTLGSFVEDATPGVAARLIGEAVGVGVAGGAPAGDGAAEPPLGA
ncbi:insoluble domain protein [Rhodococcus aetherivorans]|nr:insoluble domain protein [Rhodococcus aetherivorans]